MKRVLYIVRRQPGVLANETTDLMLVSGVFEQQTTVLFMDDGVYQLVGLDQRQSSVKALPTYGVADIHVEADSLSARGLATDRIHMDVHLADRASVRHLISRHDVVLTD